MGIARSRGRGSVLVPEDITTGELSRRVERIEQWTQTFETKTDRQFSELRLALATLGFVNKDVYEANRRSDQEALASTRTIAMWALGCVAAVVIGAIVASIIGLGGVFG